MKPFRAALFVALIAGISILVGGGCASPYANTGFTGGFNERQISRNEFLVDFSGNGYTSMERATDLCLMRCAELSLGHGYGYFAIVARQGNVDRSTAITTGTVIPTGYGSGVFFSTTQAIPKPSTINQIICFRKKPQGHGDVFDAAEVFQAKNIKYGLGKTLQTFPSTLPTGAIPFGTRPGYEGFPPTRPGDVILVDPETPMLAGFVIGAYTDAENPFPTLEEFLAKALPSAASAGAHLVIVDTNYDRVQKRMNRSDPRVGFSAQLVCAPAAWIGLEYEKGTGFENRRVIRRFTTNSRAAESGLKLGDNVLSIDGVDVL